MDHELRGRAFAGAPSRAPRPPEGPEAPAGRTGVPEFVASASSRRDVRLALVALIVALDWALPTQQLSALPRALIDEPCHFATALVVLGALTRWRR